MHIVIPLAVLLIVLVVWFRKHTKGPGGVRTGDLPKAAAKLGFLPGDRLDTDHDRAPDPEVTAVREAVRAGNWQAGADFLAAAGQDWQERDRRSSVLAREAVKDDAWLLAWRTARPEDPAAALVHAESLIDLAWEIRGAARAKYTTDEQFAGFHRVLRQAQEACAHAQSLAGDDPCPFIVELPMAMGLGYPHDRFEKIWAEIEERDPHHLAAHSAALQYWCAKWRGSHELAEAFARAAAEKGRPGQLLSALPLKAYYEYEIAHDDLNRDEFYKRPEVVAAVDAALVDVAAAAAADPGDWRIPHVRHLLASLLFWQDRHEAAVEQFRLVDGYIDAVPWSYRGGREAMIKAYTGERDYSAAQVLKARGGI
ncbi:tetratricopeptide (TPR) repeat protein [Streptomyces glaucescens]